MIPGVVAGGMRRTSDVVDPFFSNVTSLLHFDADFTDSATGVWTGVGSPSISSDKKKFGTGGLYLNGSSYLQRTSLLANVSASTLEMWLMKETVSDVGIAFSVSGGGLTLETISGKLVVGRRNTIPVLITSSVDLPNNEFVHVSVVLNGGHPFLFQNGLLVGQATNSSFGLGNFQLGAYASAGKYFTGAIDEFRYTPGVARYTSNFTPPTAPFPNS